MNMNNVVGISWVVLLIVSAAVGMFFFVAGLWWLICWALSMQFSWTGASGAFIIWFIAANASQGK